MGKGGRKESARRRKQGRGPKPGSGRGGGVWGRRRDGGDAGARGIGSRLLALGREARGNGAARGGLFLVLSHETRGDHLLALCSKARSGLFLDRAPGIGRHGDFLQINCVHSLSKVYTE